MLIGGGARNAVGTRRALGDLLEKNTGQHIDPGREWRIETALKPLLRARGLADLDALVAAITNGEPGLTDHVVDALLNQETSFFRDAAVLDMVGEAAVAMAAQAGARKLRVWSAGCASGQEPLSLAMLFAERWPDPQAAPEIVATDVSPAALTRARAARYSQFEIQRGLPIRRMMQWFDTVDGEWVARAELVRRIVFRRLNLVSDPLPIGRFDVILCRNVLLYFAAETRAEIFARFASVLRPGGLLVLGAGETVIGQTDAFRPSASYRGLYEPAFAARAAA